MIILNTRPCLSPCAAQTNFIRDDRPIGASECDLSPDGAIQVAGDELNTTAAPQVSDMAISIAVSKQNHSMISRADPQAERLTPQ